LRFIGSPPPDTTTARRERIPASPQIFQRIIMTGWQNTDNGDAVLNGWYAILISWGTPWEEDTPDVLKFENGEWVRDKSACHLPNFNHFQGPFQSYADARDWGHANDPVGKYFAERKNNKI
jgi:hypothetical protein